MRLTSASTLKQIYKEITNNPLLFSVAQRIFLSVLRETLTQYRTLHFNRGGEREVCTLATVTSCIDPSVRIVKKSPKEEPPLIFSISSWKLFRKVLNYITLKLRTLSMTTGLRRSRPPRPPEDWPFSASAGGNGSDIILTCKANTV